MSKSSMPSAATHKPGRLCSGRLKVSCFALFSLVVASGRVADNDGCRAGPWNISLRLEQNLGARLKVDAVIEVDPKRAQAALDIKRAGSHAAAYKNTLILPDVKSFAEKVKSGELPNPR